MDRGYVCFVRVQFSIKFGHYDAGGHGQDDHLFGGTNHVHCDVGKLDLSGVHIVDQPVAVHEVNPDDVVI